MGITVDLQHASTNIDFASGNISSSGAKKGDFVVTGTSGTFDATGTTFNNLRIVTLTSKCTLASCVIQNSGLITQSSAVISGCRILSSTNTPALLSNDPALISDTSFTSAGTGHAIEISAAGTYSFDGNTFTGYGSGGTTDAAVYNNSGGAVTLNITGGGGTPTVRNGAGASTTVNNAVTLTVTVKNSSNVAIQNARVAIFTDDSSETELLNALTNASGIASTSYAYTTDQSVFIRIRAASGAPAYLDLETTGTITSSGFSFQAQLQVDANV